MSSHASLEVRARGLRLLLAGASAAAAAGVLGVGTKELTIWAKLVGMEFAVGRSGGVRDRPSVVSVGAAVGHGRRLSVVDRVRIEAALNEGLRPAEIARRVGVSRSTISRELSRRPQLAYRSSRRYDAEIADHHARMLRARIRPSKLETNMALRQAVREGLNDRFSPQQIAGRLPTLFPGREDMRVSHETIYQALYVQGKGTLRQELTVIKALRSGRARRLAQSKLPARSSRPWLEGARLTDRPAEAADRAVPGHWEGDLVVGPANSGIITLVERRSRFALLARLPGTRDSKTVTTVLAEMISTLPTALKNTITWDQGSEMADHARFTIATGCPVFFCDPHSPWQRGTNENTNGLIRDFYPKGTNFNTITDADLAETQRLLNIRPRQTLHFATPAETLNEHIRNVALTT